MKKNILLGVSLSVLLLTSIVNIAIQKSAPKAEGKSPYYTENKDQLAKDSEIIVTGKVNSEKTTVTLHDVTFVITSFLVDSTVKGNIAPNTKIDILQTKNLDIDPEIKSKDNMLLFLEKYTGPITDKEVYVIKGGEQGMYKVANGKLEGMKSYNGPLKAQFEGKQLSDITKELTKLK